MNSRNPLVTVGLLVASLGVALPATAQVYLLPAAPEKGVGIEVSHPEFKEFDVTAPTSVTFLSGRMPLNARWSVFADVPFAYAKVKGGVLDSDGNSVLGNPMLGVEYRPVAGWTVDGGVRAPLTTADSESFADVIGFLSDPQRGEAFLEDVVPVSVSTTYHRSLTPEFGLRARGGVTSAIYTGDDDEVGTETFLDYGVFGSYHRGIARFGAGMSGRWMATADEGDFSDNSMHQLGLTADALVAGVRPGLSLRVPVNSTYRDVLSSSLGVYVQVPLR